MTLFEHPGLDNHARHDAVERGTTTGFFTDPTLCIGCKACEVACKEWNGIPADGFDFRALSYDNTGSLGASSWRHVAFIEQPEPLGRQITGTADVAPFRWFFLSDVCKHCAVAGCLEGCPTGAIVRTEVGSVYVQDDVCNGCGYCVVWCPFGVIGRREEGPGEGGAFKCTLCYDRQRSGRVPACAQTCPTEAILFGPVERLAEHAERRLKTLHERGLDDAAVYDAGGTSVEGMHAFFLTLGEPAAQGLPPAPRVPTDELRAAWSAAFATAVLALASALLAFAIW